MNLLARAVLLGVTGLLLTALFTAAALTHEIPPRIPSPWTGGPTNLDFASLSSVPVVHLGRLALVQPLEPGVYQTRPDAILLAVPRRGN